MPRSIPTIAAEIRKLWTRPTPSAQAYLHAMKTIGPTSSTYYQEGATSICGHFLVNAEAWTGPDATRIKQELRALLEPKTE